MDLKRILELDKKHLWHPCSQMKDYEEYPAIHIKKAKGVWLYKENGGKILDAISSWWTNIFGHTNEYILKRIKEQLDDLEHIIFANYTHTPGIILSEYLAGLFDGKLARVFYTDNGASSVEVALKMSYHYWYIKGKTRKKHFAYLRGSYHGETLGALSVCSIDTYKKIYAPLLPETKEIVGPNCYRCSYNLERTSCKAECFEHAEKLLKENSETIASVIVEPIVQCANGMNMYPPLYIQKLKLLCDKIDVHLICDEIAVGFGKTGEMMASPVVPDFVTVSKAITGGFLPLAAVLTNDEIYNTFYAPYEEQRAFMHSHTYTGNPLACAAACAVFELFKQTNVLQEVKEKGEYIRQNVQPLLEHHNVGEIRTIGIITAIELVKNKKTKEAFSWKDRIGYKIYRNAEKQGVLLRNLGDVIYFMPAYIINKDEMDFMTDIAIQSIKDILGDK